MQLPAAAHELREQRLLTEAVRGILTPAVRANLSPEQQAFLSTEASWQPPPPAAGLCTYLSCTCNVPAIPWFCVCKLLPLQPWQRCVVFMQEGVVLRLLQQVSGRLDCCGLCTLCSAVYSDACGNACPSAGTAWAHKRYGHMHQLHASSKGSGTADVQYCSRIITSI